MFCHSCGCSCYVVAWTWMEYKLRKANENKPQTERTIKKGPYQKGEQPQRYYQCLHCGKPEADKLVLAKAATSKKKNAKENDNKTAITTVQRINSIMTNHDKTTVIGGNHFWIK